MQEFIQTYLNKLDITAIIENILTKILSLLFLFLLFYIAKKLLHTMVQRVVKPSLKMSRHDVGRQKTISRLLENVFNYTLYFFLLYCILSFWVCQFLVCWQVLGLLGWLLGWEHKVFCLMSSMAFSSFLNVNWMWEMRLS